MGLWLSESRVISETVSGSVEAMKRDKFKMLINYQIESGDIVDVANVFGFC